MTTRSFRLSKSRITEYLQCPKRLFLSVHRPELREETPGMQQRFDVGNQVGRIAQSMFPDGILIGDESNDLSAALAQTAQVLRDYPDKPIFEATFSHGDMLIRADVLVPQEKGFRMVEVKSSTSVKDYYLPDCSMQSWVVENSGLRLSSISLMNINSEFIYEELGDYRGLLKETDITEQVREYKSFIPQWISESQEVLAGSEPEKNIGAHCSTPFDCPFLNHCSIDRPDFPVDLLPRNKARGTIDMLKANGFEDLREVPAGLIVHPTLERIRRLTVENKFQLDEAAREIMQRLPYPRYFLDFETIQFTVPIWIGTSPFEQLPFQWSCHRENEEGTLIHAEFLDISGHPPMRAFAESLIANLGTEGPVVVYNQAFEKSRIRELADRFPDLAQPLLAINDRVFDLLPLTREYYYHPKMKGSWSIKAVLPTIAPDLNYADLEEVQDGGTAQAAFLETITQKTSEGRRDQLKRSLLEYCKLDTYAMVRLARFLEGKQ